MEGEKNIYGHENGIFIAFNAYHNDFQK